MSYATIQDMIDQFGEHEVIALTDREVLGVPNAAVAARALKTASSDMDGYLAGRYTLPLPFVTDKLRDLCCDIARYKLCGAGVTATDLIRLRYKDAIRDLTAIRDKQMDIGIPDAGQIAAPAESASVKVASRPSVFNAGSMAGY